MERVLAQTRPVHQSLGTGADVDAQTQDADGVGRFGWVTHRGGHRIGQWPPS